jgi:hypothetical protein
MLQKKLSVLLLSAVGMIAAKAAVGQHADVLLQRQGAKVATGTANFDAGSWSMGTRVFSRDFPSDYLIDQPGFNALSSTSSAMPAGFSSLPGSSAVSWDFLPMMVDCTVSNLWYWNGQDADGDGLDASDVMFMFAPGHVLSLTGAVGFAAADGSDQLVPGGVLGTTGSNGSLHVHRDFELQNLASGGSPADGIYLIAMQVQISGLEPSDPFFVVFGTPGSTLASRNVAVGWVSERVDELAAIHALLPGDFNCDGEVDAADYVVWRTNIGAQEEYATWRANFGMTARGADSSAKLAAGASPVPEPGGLLLAILSICGFAGINFSRSRAISKWPTVR